MSYFDDITFLGAKVVPACRAVIDTRYAKTFHLQFILSGRMYLGIDGGPRTVPGPPAAFWHHPQHTYQYGPADDDGHWYHHWVVFRGPRAQRIMEKGFMAAFDKGFAPVHRPAEFADIFQRLAADVREGDPRRHAACVLRLETLLRLLIEDRPMAAQTGPHHDALERLARRIRNAPLESCNFQQEARNLHLSYSHFRRLFREQHQCPPYDFLLHHRMKWARRQLEEPDRQVKAIGQDLGIDDPARFSKLFKKRFGLSPKAFRTALCTTRKTPKRLHPWLSVSSVD
jgi:AraC family transcriptional regulator, arabinose operon regulatory protein